MEQRANGRADYGPYRRSCDIDRTTPASSGLLPTVLLKRRVASARYTRPWFLGPLIALGLASLLGCAGPVGFPALFSVKAALPGNKASGSTPVMAASLAAAAAAAGAPAATPTTPVTATPTAPQEAPEAGRRLAVAAAASRRTPQPLASLFLSLAEVVQREVRAKAPAPAPTEPPVAAEAVVQSAPPERIRSQAIDLDMEVVPVGWKQVERDGKTVSMWEVGNYVASWHKTSAMPGQTGNMVITGHNNIEGSVFRRLPDLREGDGLVVEAGGQPYTYTVETKFVVQEKDATPEQKRWNGQWIGAFPDERLTLVTCYPPDGNSHRLIVIAKPAAP